MASIWFRFELPSSLNIFVVGLLWQQGFVPLQALNHRTMVSAATEKGNARSKGKGKVEVVGVTAPLNARESAVHPSFPYISESSHSAFSFLNFLPPDGNENSFDEEYLSLVILIKREAQQSWYLSKLTEDNGDRHVRGDRGEDSNTRRGRRWRCKQLCLALPLCTELFFLRHQLRVRAQVVTTTLNLLHRKNGQAPDPIKRFRIRAAMSL